ncbi:DNA/RNA non-specific endonuclease [Chamaesiphon sp. OTE_20_metabat_361]|uniref:DNA/RNA non-specific endonuclease n=1 Tax=Chamaesiphon sp. OTE_20_metabat_361 TaxID=2964689 RepID=UPI00286ADE78|nr:DNA/RNA non-specific endonuclease [Chamaesiphon sp. OTE_20_metabat_361]
MLTTVRKIAYFPILAILIISVVACRNPDIPSGGETQGNINLLMGNPSQATSSPGNVENYLLVRPQYALSYSRTKGIPNWVSWELNASWLGDAHRVGKFAPDEDLPVGWARIKPSDYTGSGFDRGHMTNSEDRSRSPADNIPTFLMTNIIPQAPDNNQGVWVQLENYSRELVRSGKELFIVSGGHGQGGIGKNGFKATVGQGKVIVPAVTWKVILVLDRPNSGVAGVTPNTRTIAVIIPNKQGVRDDPWRQYRTSVKEVEKLTGYRFFTNVPVQVRETIAARVDNLN